jgi:hypothetical protein
MRKIEGLTCDFAQDILYGKFTRLWRTGLYLRLPAGRQGRQVRAGRPDPNLLFQLIEITVGKLT